MMDEKPIGYYDHELEWKTEHQNGSIKSLAEIRAEMQKELEKLKMPLHNYNGCTGYYPVLILKARKEQ